MAKCRKFVYVQPFDGMPTSENFRLVEEELRSLEDGEFLAEAVYLSIDPYQRAYTHLLKIGTTMIGQQLARITESRNKNYPVGSYVVGNFGWRTHTISNGKDRVMPMPPIEDTGKYPMSLHLSIFGLTGITAYFGFLDICKPAPGETVLISGAAGAVGHHVGQIAKIKNCKVIGLTGSPEKEAWLKTIGFDEVINYKTTKNLRAAISKVAPNGIDCYFDNVGGEISSIVLQKMNKYGRVSVCGSISSYNSGLMKFEKLPKVTLIQPAMVMKELEMKGFNVQTWMSRWDEAVQQNKTWFAEGKLKYAETITTGFQNSPNALVGLLNGKNIGKQLVKVEELKCKL